MEKFIKNLVRGAGAILREGFRTEFEIDHKLGRWDTVTEFDLISERFIIEKIQKKYPKHGIMSEESGHIIKKDNFWLIDPIDGTNSFSRGLAGFCVSVAFVSKNIIRYGAVYDPIADELFFAKLGAVATLNDKKIEVSQIKDLETVGIALQLGTASTTSKERRVVFDMVVKYCMWPLNTGSCALSSSYVACGRYHCTVSKHLSPFCIRKLCQCFIKSNEI